MLKATEQLRILEDDARVVKLEIYNYCDSTSDCSLAKEGVRRAENLAEIPQHKKKSSRRLNTCVNISFSNDL